MQCRKFEGNLAEASAEGASRSCGGGGGLVFFLFFCKSGCLGCLYAIYGPGSDMLTSVETLFSGDPLKNVEQKSQLGAIGAPLRSNSNICHYRIGQSILRCHQMG